MMYGTVDMLINALVIYLPIVFVQTEKIARWKKIICFGIIFLCLNLSVNFIGQWVTLIVIPAAIICTCIATKDKFLAIESAITGYLVMVTANHMVTSALSLIGFTVAHLYEIYYLTFSLIFLAIDFFLVLAVRKLIKRFFVGNNLLKKDQLYIAAILIGCLLIYMVKIILSEYANYERSVIIANSFSYFSMMAVAIIVVVIIIKKTQEESITKIDQIRLEDMFAYNAKIEAAYNDLRAFKHDYINILSTLSGYIEQTESEDLKRYFNEEIMEYSRSNMEFNVNASDLNNIRDIELKSLFAAKVFMAETKHLQMNIDIKQSIELVDIKIKRVDLLRIMGIFLDNAIEGCEASEDKRIDIGINCTDVKCSIFIGNTFKNQGVSVGRVAEEGYSTKGEGRGTGLYTVKKILNKYENITHFTTIRENYFIQKFEIG